MRDRMFVLDTCSTISRNLTSDLQTPSATMRLHPPETSKPDDCTADNDRKRNHNSKGTKVLARWDLDVHAGKASDEEHGEVRDTDNGQDDKSLVHSVFRPPSVDTKVCEIGMLRMRQRPFAMLQRLLKGNDMVYRTPEFQGQSQLYPRINYG
jgi:hypothetical protein